MKKEELEEKLQFQFEKGFVISTALLSLIYVLNDLLDGIADGLLSFFFTISLGFGVIMLVLMLIIGAVKK